MTTRCLKEKPRRQIWSHKHQPLSTSSAQATERQGKAQNLMDRGKHDILLVEPPSQRRQADHAGLPVMMPRNTDTVMHRRRCLEGLPQASRCSGRVRRNARRARTWNIRDLKTKPCYIE